MMAGSLRRGGMITKNAVLMTIVAPRPMFVRATVSEGDLDKIRTGLAATVRPAAYPDLKLAGSVSRIDGIPTASDAFDAQIDVKLDAGDQRATAVVPGMTCTAKLIPYADRRALVVPAKAVFEEELDEDSHGYADAAIGSRAAAELQRHASARSAKPARTGFRSTYRIAVSRCSSPWTGNDLSCAPPHEQQERPRPAVYSGGFAALCHEAYKRSTLLAAAPYDRVSTPARPSRCPKPVALARRQAITGHRPS
jgi:hypothetical protein